MATRESLEALEKTEKAIIEIKEKMRPFLEQIQQSSIEIDQESNNYADSRAGDGLSAVSSNVKRGQRAVQSTVVGPKPTRNPHQLALAQAAVSLSIGTLRVMGARLRGMDQGRKPDDPLRKELNRIRSLLASVRKKHNEAQELSTKETISDDTKQDDRPSEGTKRKAVLGKEEMEAKGIGRGGKKGRKKRRS